MHTLHEARAHAGEREHINASGTTWSVRIAGADIVQLRFELQTNRREGALKGTMQMHKRGNAWVVAAATVLHVRELAAEFGDDAAEIERALSACGLAAVAAFEEPAERARLARLADQWEAAARMARQRRGKATAAGALDSDESGDDADEPVPYRLTERAAVAAGGCPSHGLEDCGEAALAGAE